MIQMLVSTVPTIAVALHDAMLRMALRLSRPQSRVFFSGEFPDGALSTRRLVLGADIERRGDTVIVRPVKGSSRLK